MKEPFRSSRKRLPRSLSHSIYEGGEKDERKRKEDSLQGEFYPEIVEDSLRARPINVR